MLLFGYTFGNDIRGIIVIVVKEDKGIFNPQLNASDNISDKIISNIDTQTVKIEYMSNVSEAVNKVHNGQAYGVIDFPSNLTAGVYAKAQNESPTEKPPITVMFDKSNTDVATSVLTSFNDAISKTMNSTGLSSAVTVKIRQYMEATSSLLIFLCRE
jgi:hypothetical protein